VHALGQEKQPKLLRVLTWRRTFYEKLEATMALIVMFEIVMFVERLMLEYCQTCWRFSKQPWS